MVTHNWAGKRVLVTGAGGFIGSHLAEHLVALGAQVRALVHYNALGRWGWLDGFDVRGDLEVLLGDITDRDSVRKAAADSEIIFHLAALIGIPYSYQAPVSYVRTNVEGTLNILQAALEAGAERVVHTSTSETYGTARYVPIDEMHPLQGQSPYAATKIGADKLAESFFCSFDLPVVTVRPFNTYGPRQSARAIIPTVITQAQSGEVVRIGATTPTRDLNFVEDTARGFIAAAEADESAHGEVFNIGSGCEIAMGDLAALIVELVGRRVRIVSAPERMRPEKSEVERLLCDNSRARDQLGWHPRVALRDGLQRTIDWFSESRCMENYRHDRYQV